jgi:hypothetical protein
LRRVSIELDGDAGKLRGRIGVFQSSVTGVSTKALRDCAVPVKPPNRTARVLVPNGSLPVKVAPARLFVASVWTDVVPAAA